MWGVMIAGLPVPKTVTAPYYPERLCSWPGHSGDYKLISYHIIFIFIEITVDTTVYCLPWYQSLFHGRNILSQANSI